MSDDLELSPRPPVAEYLTFVAEEFQNQTPDDPWPVSFYERGVLEAAAEMPAEDARDLVAHNFLVNVGSRSPEKIGVRFQTTPLAGDDCDDGIYRTRTTAELTITFAGGNFHGSHCCRITDSEGNEIVFDGTNGVTIRLEAEGDYEANGMLDALAELGVRLKPLAIARRHPQGR